MSKEMPMTKQGDDRTGDTPVAAEGARRATGAATGGAERFNRTLKEQVIHGQIFRTVDELRVAVAAFVERYNAHWRVEKLGFLTPTEARLQQALAVAA